MQNDYIYIKIIIKNVNISHKVGSNTYIGGIVGYSKNSNIKECSFNGNISISGSVIKSYTMAGGIAGFYSNGTISDCYTMGNIHIINNNTQYYAGGIVGMAEGLNLSRSYSVCSVSTGGYDYSFSGGLLGTMKETIVSKCFFDGSVNASSNCYLGYVAAYTVSGEIDNCFISENVKVLRNGTEFTYGWDGVKIKKVDMETLLSYLSNNWDLSIWGIENNDYPTLK